MNGIELFLWLQQEEVVHVRKERPTIWVNVCMYVVVVILSSVQEHSFIIHSFDSHVVILK